MPGDQQEFCNKVIALVESESHHVRVAKNRTGSSEPHPYHTIATELLAKTAVRCAFLCFLSTKGWLDYQGRPDLLFALYDRWKADPQGYLFQQLLAQIISKGLSRRSFESRAMLERRIGNAPNLGTPLVHMSAFEAEYSHEGHPVLIPDSFWEQLIGEMGVLRTAGNLSLHYHGDDLDADCLAHFYHAIRKTPNAELYESSAIVRVKSELLQKEEWLRGLDPAEMVEKLNAIKIVDPSCGPGSVLVHTVRETMLRAREICQEGNLPFDQSRTVRTIIRHGLHGMDRDPFAVEITRLRLALEMVSNDPEPSPLPDLSRDIEQGDGILVVSMYTAPQEMSPEGPQVEYKSTLEWDSRLQQKSPNLLHGVLRTIVAFLNTEGGVLYIGVGDDGNPKGLIDDFALIKDAAKEDIFENKLREYMKRHIDPIPLANVNISFPEIAGIKVCQLVVRPRPDDVTYLQFKDLKTGQTTENIFVRDGNRTITLQGRPRDSFILARNSS